MKCNCCKKFDIRSVSKSINKINFEIAITSELRINQMNFGYNSKENYDIKISKLGIIKYVLEKKLDSLIENYEYCLCDCKIQKLLEEFSKLFYNKSRHNHSILVDKSNEELWLLTNKLCISKEKWEECACQYMDRLGLEFTVDTKVSELAYDISVKPVLREIIFEVTSKLKQNVNFSKTVNIKELEVQYQTIIKKHNTELSFDSYSTLINKGLDFDIINKSLSNDVSFKVDVNNENIEICTRTCNYTI